MKILLIIMLLLVILITILTTITFIRIGNIRKGDCEGVPKFDENSVYYKEFEVPLINYTVKGKLTFKKDSTFILDFGGSDVFIDNKWIYDSNNCSLIVKLDSKIQEIIDKYKSSIDTNIRLNKKGQLIVNGLILGVMPISITIDKLKK